MRYLIVGLGNPGAAYQTTRHNIGFVVVETLAARWGWSFRRQSDLEGRLAEGEIGAQEVKLLLPSTWMNRSGVAVRACVNKYQMPLEGMIVVSDDVALKEGSLRLRSRGSSGGHNGLKDIEAQLQTQYYARLRVGVGAAENEVLADYVLAPFTADQQPQMTQSVARAVDVLEAWVRQGPASAMQLANGQNKSMEEGEKNG